MRRVPIPATLVLTAALLASPMTHAGAGDDHGEAATSASGPALPRFTAASEAFELVGVVNGKQVTLYLDRAGSNEPVTDAQIEIQIGDAKLTAGKHEDTFEVELPSAPSPGVMQVTATVSVGNETDLLAGEVDTHEETKAAEPHGSKWKGLALWAVAAVAAALSLLFVRRRMAVSRQSRTGVSA